mgnify:CR=1 FL=1
MDNETNKPLTGELFPQIIDFLPYPIAIFSPQYTLVMVNKAFAEAAKMRFINPEKGTVRILQYKIDDTRLTEAVKRVFEGDTFFLEDLENPFSMFSGITRQSAPQPGSFNKAVIFPITGDAEITYGVIVFMP